MEITEKVAYLKGLLEGMDLDATKKEGKLLAVILDVLEDIALELAEIQDVQEELGEGLDAVSDDLEDVEAVVFGDDDEDDEDEDDDDEDGGYDLEDEDCYMTTCPSCGDAVFFDEDVLEEGGIRCPNCGEKLIFDLGDEEDSDEDEEASDEEAEYSEYWTCEACGTQYVVKNGSRACPKCGHLPNTELPF